jgi:hypothetical protein
MRLADITPDWLKETYLWKIPISYNDDTLLDDSLQFYIDSAISRAEILLGISIRKKVIRNESYDYRLEEWMSGYGFIQLNTRPLISVESLRINIITSEITIPSEWIQMKRKNAQINLSPYYGVLASANISNQILMFFPLLSSTNYVPQVLLVDYTAGYEAKDEIPDLLVTLIAQNATIGVLNVLGEIALGGQAALAGYSIGVDGLSQSVSTTASAENHAYSARIRMYEAEQREIVKALRQYYYGLRLSAF